MLFHEALGHAGLAQVFGRDMARVLDDVVARRRIDVLDMAKAYGLDPKSPADLRIAAEEVLAELAQSRPEIAFVQRAIAAVRTFLRKLGLPLRLTDAELIRNYIEPARRQVEQGAPAAAGAKGTRYSRRADGLMSEGGPDLREKAKAGMGFANIAMQAIQDSRANGKRFAWWRGINTQYHKATLDSHFKAVYDSAQQFSADTSRLANEAADLAPNLLPQLDKLSDVWKKVAVKKADLEAISKPIFEGTLADRDPAKGRVWTDEELRAQFKLNDRQVGLYREFRTAVVKSLDDMGKGEIIRFAWGDIQDRGVTKEQIADAPDVTSAAAMVTKVLESEVAESTKTGESLKHEVETFRKEHFGKRAFPGTPAEASKAMYDALDDGPDRMAAKDLADRARRHEDRAADLRVIARTVKAKAERVQSLKDGGYAPLMRFGPYAVTVREKTGSLTNGKPDYETLYFSTFDNLRDANRHAREIFASIKAEHPNAELSQGLMSAEEHKLFAGVTPDTLEIFGEAAGLDSDAMWKEYIRIVKNSRSALKRMLERKGTAGYSQDVTRVLAAFITSNARAASGNIHSGEMVKAVQAIPQGKGDVKDEAVKLVEYLRNPQEEAAKLRGLMFTWFLGGSVASAAVNLTQPLTMTFPYLSQFESATKAAARLTRAAKDVFAKELEPDLQRALGEAERKGIVSPQEMHYLQAEVSRSAGNNLVMRKVMHVWGSLFAAAEQFNRRSTFIAAFRQAKDRGLKDPFGFASESVTATQGVYNKANRPNWARGALGATVFTFKQYSIGYLEFVGRLLKSKDPQQRKAGILAIGVLIAMSGLSGLPGSEDLDDLIDTLAQAAGYNFQSDAAKKQFLANLVGNDIAEFALRGLSSIPGMPIDVQQRLGVGNLIPGTGAFLKSTTDHTRDAIEVAGAAGGLLQKGAQAVKSALAGDLGGAGSALAPVAVSNALKMADMLQTGMYRDTRGRRVSDVDVTDAVWKGIGFQPANVAKVQREQGQIAGMVNINKTTKGEISDLWSEGLFERDQTKVDRARAQLRDWNEKNPDQPMRIDVKNVQKRVRQMNLTRAERIVKTTPRELRASVARELSDN